METNTNRALPLTPDNRETRVFRFPKIKELDALYKLHLQLIEKHAAGQWAQGEPKGGELERLVNENYGPAARQGRLPGSGKNGQRLRLTCKGTLLMTWRGLWPTSVVRKALQRKTMHSELQALPVRAVTELQKA